MSVCEGTIEIDMVEFWDWICHKNDITACSAETSYGVPRVTGCDAGCGGGMMLIDFASDSDDDPANWNFKPACLKQWDELRKKMLKKDDDQRC